ncbi:MAG: RNA polymerase sigma factor [Planctomycetota bacterium]
MPDSAQPDPQPVDGDDLKKTVVLVAAIQSGDSNALEELFGRYLPRVRQTVALRLGRRLRDMVDIEDVVQESLVRALRGIDNFQHGSDGSFRNWLSRCVQSAIVDIARSETRKKRGEGKVRRFSDQDSSILHDSIFGGGGGSPSEHAVAGELVERLEEELLKLPEHERELVVMRSVCGMSFAEIAAEVGITSAATVRVAFHRVSKKLHQRVTG